MSLSPTPLRHIPLLRLVLSPDNARHTRADGTHPARTTDGSVFFWELYTVMPK